MAKFQKGNEVRIKFNDALSEHKYAIVCLGDMYKREGVHVDYTIRRIEHDGGSIKAPQGAMEVELVLAE